MGCFGSKTLNEEIRPKEVNESILESPINVENTKISFISSIFADDKLNEKSEQVNEASTFSLPENKIVYASTDSQKMSNSSVRSLSMQSYHEDFL